MYRSPGRRDINLIASLWNSPEVGLNDITNRGDAFGAVPSGSTSLNCTGRNDLANGIYTTYAMIVTGSELLKMFLVFVLNSLRSYTSGLGLHC